MHECSAMHASRFDAVAWNVLKFEFRNLPCPILKVKSLCSQKSIHQIQNLAGLNFNSPIQMLCLHNVVGNLIFDT